MDAQTALNEINARNAAGNPMSVTELRALADQIDAGTGGVSLILNSYALLSGRSGCKLVVNSFHFCFCFCCIG